MRYVYVRRGYRCRGVYVAPLFGWCLGTYLLFFFEVKPMPQLKKIKGRVAQVPCQDNAENYHEGFYSC